ncbi:MAG: cobalamin B12-binding domain-containing protein [Chloroflexi bacterium]|nr:cobalamin B12-binding domain-containing protein [Chloroflexota bacterium]
MQAAPPPGPPKHPIRVLVAKPGLDGHDRGAKALTFALRDAGMEVIYTGIHRTPEEIVKTALEEDVDVIGLSILSGAHLHLSKRVIDLMKQEKLTDVLLLVGGLIPTKDIQALKDLGVHGVFPAYSRFEDIVDSIRGNVRVGRGQA